MITASNSSLNLADWMPLKRPNQQTGAGDVLSVNSKPVDTSGKVTYDPAYQEILDQRQEALKTGTSLFKPVSMPSAAFAQLFSERSALQEAVQETPSTDGSAPENSEGSEDVVVRFSENLHSIHIGGNPAPRLVSQGDGFGYYENMDVLSTPDKRLAYERQQVTDLMDTLALEDRLKAQYGDDIKLAYDERADQYTMLKPGQAGYDEVKTGAEALDGMRDFFQKARRDTSQFQDIFASYGRSI